ncbi:MAG: enoyl-CoA hydratase/isomerase family protein [Dehalococcoidia bacterium]|nr:enoyl-CoA hydratase/isomerase family protein [Dehalococcoidia bacterium]
MTSGGIGPFANILYEEQAGVAILTINRPAVHNAISLATMDELETALAHLEASDSVHALVLTGAGDKSFVSGGDLMDFERLNTHDLAAGMSRRMQRIMARLNGLPMPVIGAVNGNAFGGGCEVALACDIRVASRDARMGFLQVTLGITPAWGGRERLLRLTGRSRALLLMLTGDVFTAEEAHRMGLVDVLAEPGQARETALALARRIGAQPPLAVRLIKQATDFATGVSPREAESIEADLFARSWLSADHDEALRARKEKRPPRFTGK